MGLNKKPLTNSVKVSGEASKPIESKKQFGYKGTTPEERMSRDRSMQIGGHMHDVAQIYSVLYQIHPEKSDDELVNRAVTVVAQARKLLDEKIDR